MTPSASNNNYHEFACVMLVAGCYIATQVTGKMKRFVSKHPETELKVAQTAAQRFASENNIPYVDELKKGDRAFITIIKYQEQWYPAELWPDKIVLLTKIEGTSLGGDQTFALICAESIALTKNEDFIPSIGISLDKKN